MPDQPPYRPPPPGPEGNAELARRTIRRLLEVQPAWRDDARRLLEKSIYESQIVDRLMHDLAAAGLPDGS